MRGGALNVTRSHKAQSVAQQADPSQSLLSQSAFCVFVYQEDTYYDFYQNEQRVRSDIAHFQVSPLLAPHSTAIARALQQAAAATGMRVQS